MNAALDWRAAPVPVIAGLGDTRLRDRKPYRAQPLGELLANGQPQSAPKKSALAFLPSLYAEFDAREHAAQRERGQFVALVGDIDKGDHPLDLVADRVAAVAGEAAWTIYSTASARPDDRRWRVVIPLAEAVGFDAWHDAQLALVEALRGDGFELDMSAARAGQIAFLPNVPAEARDAANEPLFFERVASDPAAGGLELWHGPIADAIGTLRAQREADDAERERIKAEALRRRPRNPASSDDGGSMIEDFNRENAVATMLERYGFKQSPRHGQDWRSPMQTSDSFATRVIESGKWISLSASDAASGLGERCAAGCFGDSFDLFAHFEHGGDRKAALRELHREREAAQFTPDYDPRTGEIYEQRGERKPGESSHMREGFDPISGDTIEPPKGPEPFAALDLIALAKVPAKPKRFAIERIAPAGEVTLFTGPGSAGKSLLSQQFSTAAAAGKSTLGFQIEKMPSLYLTCEDDAEQLHWRQQHLCEALGSPMSGLAGNLHLVSLRGMLGNELATFTHDSVLKPTKAYERLEVTLRMTGARIAFLDNVAHLYAGNENDRHQVAAFLNSLNRLAGETDAAIMLLGHPNKSGDSYSGTTAWPNQVRAHAHMEHDLETDMRTLTIGKANYARKGDQVRFFWRDWAFIGEEELPPDRAREFMETQQAAGDNEVFLACLREMTRQRRAVSDSPNATNYAPKVFVRMPEAKGLKFPRLVAALDRLFRRDMIKKDELWKGADRKAVFGLKIVAEGGAVSD